MKLANPSRMALQAAWDRIVLRIALNYAKVARPVTDTGTGAHGGQGSLGAAR